MSKTAPGGAYDGRNLLGQGRVNWFAVTPGLFTLKGAQSHVQVRFEIDLHRAGHRCPVAFRPQERM